MSVVRGLDAIGGDSWETLRPTEKQLNWVRKVLGEDWRRALIIMDVNRGHVAKLIDHFITEIKFKQTVERELEDMDFDNFMDLCQS